MAESASDRIAKDCTGDRRGRMAGLWGMVVAFGLWGGEPATASAADIGDAEALFRAGKYDECAAMAAGVIGDGGWADRWAVLKIRSELARGKYPEALATVEYVLPRHPVSVPLHWLARDVYRFNGRDDDAAGELDTVGSLIVNDRRSYGTPVGLLTVGRFLLGKGADARKVLDQCYDPITRQFPDLPEGHFATAELALLKQDNALAASTLAKAPKEAANDPHYHALLALAYAEDDRARSAKELVEALKLNPNHADSLLLQAEQLIDGERYDDATAVLKRVFAVNPKEPRAWTLTAVVAHLKEDKTGEASALAKAKASWATNPEVPHLFGRKLSDKYRFAEGSTAQREALRLDTDYSPAKAQLCQDLLRLGKEDEGWALADEIFSRDAYNVLAYNLVTLRDGLKKFATLEADGFVVRMDPREAELYGPRVLALLGRAKKTLVEKYGATVPDPVLVEIFPGRKEFAVRTFGLPGAEGFLGVCFGAVITANSPASQGESPSNWEAVLWHEYCHVVTLGKTRNKMPRWLSEGISVYEEGRQDPAWGGTRALNPKYRAMFLGDELTPLSKLSSAFLAPKSALHLQFAYQESALAVEFLVAKAGLPALKGLLDDLGAGVPTNDALPKRAKMTLELMDRDFAAFARERARKVAPDLTWEEPDGLAPGADSAAISAWLATHPKSFQGRRLLGARLVAEGKWREAKAVLEKFLGEYPEYVGPENAYVLLAAVYRKTSDPVAERKILEALASRDGDAVPAYARLMEMDDDAKDWKGLAENARRVLAVNPLTAGPHRQLAKALDHLGERAEAIAEYRAVARLDDTDPAEVHFHLATLLKRDGKPEEARREVLKALEDAPRFLEAQALLLELVDADKTPEPKGRD